jgi:hypothetical protein
MMPFRESRSTKVYVIMYTLGGGDDGRALYHKEHLHRRTIEESMIRRSPFRIVDHS